MNERQLFSITLQLYKKQPWLADKHTEVMSLLYEDCRSSDERELLIELLNRFNFLEEKEFNHSLNRLADEIVNDKEIESRTTQIVSLTADNYSDSGQSILYALKPRLEKREWREHLSINRFGSSYKEFIRNGGKHKNILFIDEYIGSGQTAIGRVDSLKKQYSEKGIEDIHIKLIVIAASSLGVHNLKEKGIEMTCMHEIKRGISDYYKDENEIIKHLGVMNKIEDILSQSYNEKPLPKMGFGSTESLYGREYGNTPNNVFPIFWWPFYRDTSKRQTILTRAMRDA
ncbi:hypothetical protein JHU04_001706 [Brenneria sp. 4F2]|uniref:phosphoribosyltransferase-like protein n=1 Tax=Pectobacterium actinidiae TaxID=1507808 RepID=UPI001EFC1CB9|nr:hypothetical protein [Brenneria bubanii]